MYQDKVAVALKVNGKVLREFGDTVYIPFGSEYSLFIKNLNTVRCLVSIEIDGQDVGDGSAFVVPANGSINIERFIKNGNLSSGQRFKFIERTSKIEEHRGVGVEDGLIRVEFEFEKPVQTSTFYIPPVKEIHHYHHDYWPYRTFGSTSGISGSLGDSAQLRSVGSADLMNVSYASNASISKGMSQPEVEVKTSGMVNDAGITVGGSVSSQQFTKVDDFPTDGVKHVMVMKLLGEVGQNKVQEPITVKTKQKCPTCGHMNKATAKFCSECGTGLVVA